MDPHALSSTVRRVMAQVTRYPEAILVPDAHLEDDLGIDSVKQAEIFAVLTRELGLPAAEGKREVRTVRDVEIAVAAALGPVAAVAAPVSAPPAPPAIASPASSMGDVEARVRAVVARVTRYPEAILVADAHLEDDLGIDSVKQAEIGVAVERELGLPAGVDLRKRKVARLGDIYALVAELLPATPSTEAVLLAAAVPTPVPVSRPLAGKVALVTGSGRGLGADIVRHLARLGATVVVNSFHSRDAGEQTAAAIRAEGGNAVHVWGSVAHPEHVDRLFATIEAEFGGLDLLVCNASDGFIGPFDQIEPAHWDRAFRTNVSGTHACAVQAARLMERRGGGAIVTMSTVTAHRYLQGFGCQGVVKAAVESLTRYLACELAPQGIRVNCVSAGPVYGDLIEKFGDSDTRIGHWEQISPGGALVRPEDVVAVVEMLLDPRAARVTGAVWTVDNGVSTQIDGRLPRLELDAVRPLAAASGIRLAA